MLLSFVVSSLAAAAERTYEVRYSADFDPASGMATVAVEVRQPRRLLRELTFTAPPTRYRDFEADGELTAESGRIVWRVPRNGGTLQFKHVVDHRRGNGGFDARMTPHWALLKADKLVPPVAARAVRGARARASLAFSGPEGWLFQSRYGRHREPIAFDDPDRSFDRPTGWIVAGRIASRREDIAGRYVMVAGPSGQGLRHNDMLAFLNWNLPLLVEVLPDFPERFLIVSAREGTWRGGLSGEASLYVHGDRPFISQNGTSTIVHELVHVGSRLSGRDGGDWFVEGLAEFYALEILFRSGTISKRRRDLALDQLRQWSEAAPSCIHTDRSKGPNTARAVLVLHELDAEIREATAQGASLDNVMRALSELRRPLAPADLDATAAQVMGRDSKVLGRVNRCEAKG